MGESQNNLQLYRPLVGVAKEDIFEYAHQKRIPYLKDTTVKSSERWKVRNVVSPAVHHMNAYDGFFTMANTCKEMALVYETFLGDLRSKWETDKQLALQFAHPLVTSQYFAWRFWNFMAAPVSRKSIGEYIRRLAGLKNETGVSQRIVLNSGFLVKVKVSRLEQLLVSNL